MANLQHTWQPPTSGPPDTYNIYEGPGAGQETLLTNLPGTQTTYSHARAAGPYAAYVTAVTAGAESGPSNETTGIISAPPIASAPILAASVQPGGVLLQCTVPSS